MCAVKPMLICRNFLICCPFYGFSRAKMQRLSVIWPPVYQVTCNKKNYLISVKSWDTQDLRKFSVGRKDVNLALVTQHTCNNNLLPCWLLVISARWLLPKTDFFHIALTIFSILFKIVIIWMVPFWNLWSDLVRRAELISLMNDQKYFSPSF